MKGESRGEEVEVMKSKTGFTTDTPDAHAQGPSESGDMAMAGRWPAAAALETASRAKSKPSQRTLAALPSKPPIHPLHPCPCCRCRVPVAGAGTHMIVERGHAADGQPRRPRIVVDGMDVSWNCARRDAVGCLVD